MDITQEKLDQFLEESKVFTKTGKLASYIPELLKANPDALGIYIKGVDGTTMFAGDIETRFTIQSVSKVCTLIYALEAYGDEVFTRIGVEQTADAFNSIIKLETRNNGKPLNPLINAGAIATTSFIVEKEGIQGFDNLKSFIRRLAKNETIEMNESVYKSEQRTGNINRALAYFQKGAGTFNASVDDVLTSYFKTCSLEVDVKDLANIARIIANNGLDPETGVQYFSAKNARMTKAIMSTCGMYDSSGEFALTVGIPSKSGVGGGIMSVVPGKYGIGIVGPALDEKGNSAAGVQLLSKLSTEYGLSIFA